MSGFDIPKKIMINHGISISFTVYELFRTNCKIIKPSQRFFPMDVQILKLDINTEFTKKTVELTYMFDCLGLHEKPISIFLAKEFCAELNVIFKKLCSNTTTDNMNGTELRKEYLEIFPLVANDSGLYTVSIDLVPGGLDEFGSPTIKNKFFVTCRELDESSRLGKVFLCVWEFDA
jgi:hypothetical protein